MMLTSFATEKSEQPLNLMLNYHIFRKQIITEFARQHSISSAAS